MHTESYGLIPGNHVRLILWVAKFNTEATQEYDQNQTLIRESLIFVTSLSSNNVHSLFRQFVKFRNRCTSEESRLKINDFKIFHGNSDTVFYPYKTNPRYSPDEIRVGNVWNILQCHQCDMCLSILCTRCSRGKWLCQSGCYMHGCSYW
jgi:hypothetical protein